MDSTKVDEWPKTIGQFVYCSVHRSTVPLEDARQQGGEAGAYTCVHCLAALQRVDRRALMRA